MGSALHARAAAGPRQPQAFTVASPCGKGLDAPSDVGYLTNQLVVALPSTAIRSPRTCSFVRSSPAQELRLRGFVVTWGATPRSTHE
jgi:hypothetical protein